MNNLVLLELYYDIYINICFFLVLFTLLHTAILKIDDPKNILFIKFMGVSLFLFLLLYLGQRPVSGKYFGDMRTYYNYFAKYSSGSPILGSRDKFFHIFMKFFSFFVSVNNFFTILMFIYLYPMLKVSKTLFKDYWYYAFLMFVVSFSFYSYGTNGVRNGAATSLFLLGLSFKEKKTTMAVCFLFSVLFHKTMLLPVIAFVLTYFYNNPRVYIKAWLACIPLSLMFGSVWVVLFSGLGFADDRLAGYLTTEMDPQNFSNTGFRWDFLFHSAFALFSGWYFVVKKKFKDNFYNQLLNTYILCNGFWILVIKANFSNRFAYLSWFIMGLVIIYPLLKQQFFKNQHLLIGQVLFVYFMFTFLMYHIFYN